MRGCRPQQVAALRKSELIFGESLGDGRRNVIGAAIGRVDGVSSPQRASLSEQV